MPEQASAEIVAVFAYPDHHAYRGQAIMERMRALAEASRRRSFATTERIVACRRA